MTTATKTLTRTSSLLALFQALARGVGEFRPVVRPHNFGYGDALIIRPGLTELPPAILDRMELGDEVLAPIVLQAIDGQPATLTAFAVMFGVKIITNKATNHRRVVDPASIEEVNRTLQAFPFPPAFVADAVIQVTAFWPLRDPIPLAGPFPPPALQTLTLLAQHLGGDLDAAQSLTTLYAVDGPIRNWPAIPDTVTLLAVAPEATFTPEQLLQACASEPDAAAARPPAARPRKVHAE